MTASARLREFLGDDDVAEAEKAEWPADTLETAEAPKKTRTRRKLSASATEWGKIVKELGHVPRKGTAEYAKAKEKLRKRVQPPTIASGGAQTQEVVDSLEIELEQLRERLQKSKM